MDKLTVTQQKVLEYIESHIVANGYPPTVREIAEALGYQSSATPHGILDRLVVKGYVERQPDKPRAIRVVSHVSK
ncbi:MarR family transcriptional regulator [Paenibacillus gorillae]|uniref:LexA family protein n=1 Tax=Paenibacillus gorillae TaxID=1243662 RepID=UPI000694DF93